MIEKAEADTGQTPGGEPTPLRAPIGIVLERRESRHPWLDYAWKVAAVIVGAAPRDPKGEWTITAQGEGWMQFHAGTLTMTLYPGESEGYRLNLSQKPPRLFVVLRQSDGPGARHELVPFHVTACPFEAQEYLDGDEVVEPVAMPGGLIGVLEEYVARCPLPQAFYKRRRKSWREGSGGGLPEAGTSGTATGGETDG